MADAYTGEIRAFGFGFVPRNWMVCDGAMLLIHEYPALYSIIGTQFGRRGSTMFQLPDLRGRMPIGAGAGPGLTHRTLGDTPGAGKVTLSENQIPPHNHAMNAFFPESFARLISRPQDGARLSYEDRIEPGPATVIYAYSSRDPNVALSRQSLSEYAGGGEASENAQPYQVFNFGICVNGEYPPYP